uniref:Uncharacterized protein n=1 Tax=Opuntia streptacantha TaxID=393608 RepID=A0A7C9CPT4_OPUST
MCLAWWIHILFLDPELKQEKCKSKCNEFKEEPEKIKESKAMHKRVAYVRRRYSIKQKYHQGVIKEKIPKKFTSYKIKPRKYDIQNLKGGGRNTRNHLSITLQD